MVGGGIGQSSREHHPWRVSSSFTRGFAEPAGGECLSKAKANSLQQDLMEILGAVSRGGTMGRAHRRQHGRRRDWERLYADCVSGPAVLKACFGRAAHFRRAK
jgi:hypothetical protein